MKITNVNPRVETVTITHADGHQTIVVDVVAVEYGPAQPAPVRRYIDCAAVPADIAQLRYILERDGAVRLKVRDKNTLQFVTVVAVAYNESGISDDMTLLDGTQLTTRYWSANWAHPFNPSRVARAVYGYWL